LHLVVDSFARFDKNPDPAARSEVGQVMGAFLLIRRDLFTRLEGFDERFFLYYEDVEL
jgi:GT2 family glycosyltransferase